MRKYPCHRLTLLALILIAGCSGRSGQHTDARVTLDAHTLENATYTSDILPLDTFTLKDGYYEDAEHQMTVHLSDMHAFGDIDGDGWEDAVVILVGNAGGSGVFHEMAAVVNDRGAPDHRTSILLGDRVEIRSLSIVGGEILLEMTTHGEDDPYCCPTRDVTERYRLEGDRIVLISSEAAQPPSAV